MIEHQKEINPKKLIAVHTEHPQDFLVKFPQIILLEDGECFQF
jgi:hypothetical protein